MRRRGRRSKKKSSHNTWGAGKKRIRLKMRELAKEAGRGNLKASACWRAREERRAPTMGPGRRARRRQRIGGARALQQARAQSGVGKKTKRRTPRGWRVGAATRAKAQALRKAWQPPPPGRLIIQNTHIINHHHQASSSSCPKASAAAQIGGARPFKRLSPEKKGGLSAPVRQTEMPQNRHDGKGKNREG